MPPVDPPRATRAWVVLAAGVAAYLLAVMHRTTFGVSGVAAAERFAVGPDVLASFVLIQVAVYLAMQVPAGLLLDRWGSRAMLTTGSLVMAAGQGLLALTTDLPFVYVGRVVVGAGDALMFVSMLALVPRWFPARSVPFLTQVSATTGQLGQVLSAVPFLMLLQSRGWTPAYGAAAALGVLMAVVVVAVVRNAPYDVGPVPAMSLPEIGRAITVVWRNPGTRLGFFTHMGSQFSGMVFALLWGVPYLVQGQGRSLAEAGALLTLFIAASVGFAPLMGVFAARHPLRRSWLVLSVIGLNAGSWGVVLLLGEPAPLWLLAALVVALAAGGPGSVLGFDFARTFNETHRLGLAQSVVNLGGFSATVVVLQAVGLVMEAAGGYTFEAFRVAWLVQYPVWALALAGVLVQRRRSRAWLAAQGIRPRRLRDVWRSARL